MPHKRFWRGLTVSWANEGGVVLIRQDKKWFLLVERIFAARGYLSFVLALLAVMNMSCFDLARAGIIIRPPAGNSEGSPSLPAQQSAPGSNTPDSKAAVVVPPDVQSNFPDIVRMITQSDVMDSDEQQYWIDILPEMTAEQLEKLAALLGIEKDKMDALEDRYRNELSELNKQAR